MTKRAGLFYAMPLGLLLLAAGCTKKESQPADPFDVTVAKQIADEAYGTDPLQKADVYLPANRTESTKTMVLIHGGFWTTGDKKDMDTLLGAIREADPALCIVNMNYKLANGTASTQHPSQMNDIKLLLDHLQTKADVWHIGKRIALAGVSSGAHMALLYAYAYDNDRRVKTVASVIGPTNFADPYYTGNPIFQDFAIKLFGKTWAQDSALYKSASPLYRVTTTAPPTFLAYGGSDFLIPVSNPDTLRKKLNQLNIPNQYWLYPTEGHELSRTAILDIIKNLAAFFKQYL